jgi:hypothetical protein
MMTKQAYTIRWELEQLQQLEEAVFLMAFSLSSIITLYTKDTTVQLKDVLKLLRLN